MAKFCFENELDLEVLREKKVAVLGYGDEGYKSAIYLYENGVDVTLGLNDTNELWEIKNEINFNLLSIGEATRNCDVLLMISPQNILVVDYVK